MTKIQNPKQITTALNRFGICDLFGICLPAVFLAGCLGFVILDTQLPRWSRSSLIT